MGTPRLWARALGHQGAGRLFRYCRRRGRFLYLLPNQALLRARAGGVQGSQGRLETLTRFATQVVERAWPEHRLLAEQDRWIPLARVIARVASAGQLTVSSAIAGTSGYVAAVAAAIGRLKRAGWAPDRLGSSNGMQVAGQPHRPGSETGGRRPQEVELALIWAAYEEALREHQLIDVADLPVRAAEALRAGHGDSLLEGVRVAALEGFFGLTPGERALCEALADRLPEVWVEALDEPGEPLFAPIRAALAGWPVGRPAALQTRPTPDPLTFLERSLFREAAALPAAPPVTAERLTLVTGPGLEGEVVAVARTLKALLLKHQLRLDQVGLIVPDLDRYGPLLRATFRRYGIPLQAAAESVAAFPVGRIVLDLVGLAEGDWTEGRLLRLLRTPYLASLYEGLAVTDAADWLAGALCAWPPARTAAEWQVHLDRVDAGAAASVVQAALSRLQELVAPLAVARPIQELCDALVAVLEAAGIEATVLATARRAPHDPETLTRVARELGALAAVRRTLKRMARLYALGSEGRTTRPGEFLHLLERELERETHRTDAKAPGPGVQVLGPGQSYGRRFPAAVVMGLAEGMLPRTPESDFLLPLERREALGLPGFDDYLARERLLFLTALTRSERFLLLSYPGPGEGEEYLRSGFLAEALELLGDQVPTVAVGTEALLPADPAAVWSADEARLWAARHEAPWSPDPAPFAEPGALALLAKRFPADQPLGISRVQTQAHCGFRNLGEILGLEPWERWKPGLGALETGSLRHRILARFWRGWSGPLTQAEAVRAKEHLQATLAAELASVESPFEQAVTRRWAEAWLEGEIALQEASRGLRPRWLELGFGLPPSEERDSDSIPEPLRLTTADGEALFRGIIDRVDVAEDGSAFLVYDYKGGASNYDAALRANLAFQPPLYALAVRQALLPAAQVAGVGYYLSGKAKSGRLERIALFQQDWAPPKSRSGLTAEAMEERLQAVAREAVQAALRLRQGDFRPAPRLACPSYCPLRFGCRSYDPDPPQTTLEPAGGNPDAP